MVKFAVRLIHLCRKFTIIIVVILSHLENVKSCTASIMQDFELVLQTAYVVNVKILHQLDYFLLPLCLITACLLQVNQVNWDRKWS